jgi:hypothetical protein
MGIAEIEQDLKIIRKIMESSSRYTNIPASGYLVTGVLGCLGVWGTYAFLGWEKISDITLITPEDMKMLALIWSLVFAAAIGTVAFFSWRKARRHKISAWNSLAARMVFSQIPLVIVIGVLTVTMAIKGYYDLIPAMWLGIYGTVLYSFSYFTGFEHKIEGSMFIILGIIAGFVSHTVALALLGIGFGGIHIMAGVWRLLLSKKIMHVSEPVE